MSKNDYPTERFAKDVEGMPVFAAHKALAVVLGPDSMAKAVARDDKHCAIAEGCRTQLQTPYVSVGRDRTDLALPHPKGVKRPGFGDALWAVWRFSNPSSAREIIILADTDKLNRDSGVVVQLAPLRKSCTPSGRWRDNGRKDRTSKGIKPRQPRKNGQDKLTLMGVRNLNGQRSKARA